MWVQKDTPRTKQEILIKLLFFVVLGVKLIHDQIVDSLQLFFILNGAQDGFTVFLHTLENADFQIFFLVHAGRNHGEIRKAVVFQLAQHFQLEFSAVFVNDGHKIRTVLIFHNEILLIHSF